MTPHFLDIVTGGVAPAGSHKESLGVETWRFMRHLGCKVVIGEDLGPWQEIFDIVFSAFQLFHANVVGKKVGDWLWPYEQIAKANEGSRDEAFQDKPNHPITILLREAYRRAMRIKVLGH